MRSRAALYAAVVLAAFAWALDEQPAAARSAQRPAVRRHQIAVPPPAVMPAPAPATVPEAPAGVGAPGGPIFLSSGTADQVTPTTLGTLPVRF